MTGINSERLKDNVRMWFSFSWPALNPMVCVHLKASGMQVSLRRNGACSNSKSGSSSSSGFSPQETIKKTVSHCPGCIIHQAIFGFAEISWRGRSELLFCRFNRGHSDAENQGRAESPLNAGKPALSRGV